MNETKYHDKLLGQWFVVSAALVFENGNLTNKVTAVKVNTQFDLKLGDDV